MCECCGLPLRALLLLLSLTETLEQADREEPGRGDPGEKGQSVKQRKAGGGEGEGGPGEGDFAVQVKVVGCQVVSEDETRPK